MTAAWTPLATTMLSSAASSVTFGSIPSGYRDLNLVVQGGATSNFQFRVRFNGDTGANYPYVQMYGEPNGYGSDANTLDHIRAVFGNTATTGMAILQIMNYSATDKHKTVLAREQSASESYIVARASRWASNSAISSIEVIPHFGSLQTNTTFSLWGLNTL